MKNFCLFFGCLFFLLTSCAHKNLKKNPEDQFKALWHPIISLLMSDPESGSHWSHHDVTLDLLLLVENELTKLKSLWQQAPKLNASKKELMKQENQFFQKEFEKLNEDIIARLLKSQMSRSVWKDYSASAQEVINMIESHPVTSSKNIFAHKNGNQIGFCFARALLTHYLLLKRGIPQRDISKIFIVGAMKVGVQFWHFHVAVMVADSNLGFLVVDPMQGRLYGYKEWMDINRRYSIKYPFSRLRFFVTDPRKFLPSSGMYDLDSLSQPVFKEFFYSLAQAINDDFSRNVY